MYSLLTAKLKWPNYLNLKVNVKVTKSLFSKLKKTWISANLNQFWLSIAVDDKEIHNMVIEDNVYTINSKTKMDQEIYSAGQGQGH